MANSLTKEELQKTYYMKSRSPAYLQVLRECEHVARTNVNILLLGKSGTGKEVAAQYIHSCSERADKAFVAVNCSAYPDALMESELFGHERGAFTGALSARVGRFAQANGGTLFIDEVGEISSLIQVKLLRAIETKTIERIGTNVGEKIDFRLISATNKDPVEEVMAGRMREDFLYRISTIVIRLPSLQERKEDIDDLIKYFLTCAQEEHHIDIIGMDPEVRDFLYNYEYPGNIRELKSIIVRMVVLSENGIIHKNGLPKVYDLTRGAPASPPGYRRFDNIIPWRKYKAVSESEYLRFVLEQNKWNVSVAARLLEISSRQLFNKIIEYNLRDSEVQGR